MQNLDATQVELAAWIGADQAEQVTRWARDLSMTISPEQLLTAGRSGSVVGLVTIRRVTGDYRAVLKFNGDGTDTQEGSQHEEALEANTAFSDRHLVALTAPPFTLTSGSSITLQRLAGGDRRAWQPLASLSGRTDVREGISSIARSLLEDWNTSPQATSRTVAAFLGHRVTRRLEPLGALTEWIVDQLGPDVLRARWLTFSATPGAQFVNPVSLAREAPDGFASRLTTALVGNSHGDLHIDNVMLPVEGLPKPSEYRLIDLASYQPAQSLTDDHANLLLSEIERVLVNFRSELQRNLLDWLASDGQVPLHTELEGLTETWATMQTVGDPFARDRGFGQEWRSQFWLSITSAALVLASRDRLSEALRMWFFELAAIGCTHWCELNAAVPEHSTPALVGPPLDEPVVAARGIADQITQLCSNFDASASTIAIVPRGTLQSWSVVHLGGVGWDLLVEFDEAMGDADGNFELARRSGARVRLVQPSQEPVYSRDTTTWLAGSGLSPVGAKESLATSFRTWRRQHLTGVRRAVDALVSSAAGPAVVVVFGEPDEQARAVAEAAIDSAGDRVAVVVIARNEDDALSALEATSFQADPDLVALALAQRVDTAQADGATPTLPGPDGGRIFLEEEERAWLEEGYEVLHSLVGLESDSIDGVGRDFYSGRDISWFELASDVDLPRQPAVPALSKELRTKLERRSTERHPFGHYPGAGGTTIARRAAWDLHRLAPTLIASRVLDPFHLADRIERIAVLTDRKVLVVLESTTERVVDGLYERLRSNSVPALLLLVERAPRVTGRFDPAHHLESMADDEITAFRRMFGAMHPERRDQLDKIGKRGHDVAVPFMYALTAFREDFVGLEQYVRQYTDTVQEELKAVVIGIALIHRFAGSAANASLFCRSSPTPSSRASTPGSTVRGSV